MPTTTQTQSRLAPLQNELHVHEASTIAVVSHSMIGKAMIVTLLDLSEDETL